MLETYNTNMFSWWFSWIYVKRPLLLLALLILVVFLLFLRTTRFSVFNQLSSQNLTKQHLSECKHCCVLLCFTSPHPLSFTRFSCLEGICLGLFWWVKLVFTNKWFEAGLFPIREHMESPNTPRSAPSVHQESLNFNPWFSHESHSAAELWPDGTDWMHSALKIKIKITRRVN